MTSIVSAKKKDGFGEVGEVTAVDTKALGVAFRRGDVVVLSCLGKAKFPITRLKADDWFNKLISSAESIKELDTALEKQGGFVRIPFCTDRSEGQHCAEKIKDDCKANVRGSLFTKQNEKPKNERCVVCGKTATIYLYVARQY